MASRAFANYVIGHLIQFKYMKIRKRHNKETHRHERKNLSLLYSDYNRVTNSCIISYILKTYGASSSQKKKKRQGKEAEDKGERQNEGKERKREMSEKEQEKEAKYKGKR